ncbi:UDP-N-acetylmuramoyl-L-alanyl-D-glutamate--2,6-diaminopimelate ligase [Vibrio albus]|uniref:UDP-N-acetylmuramoyl-L-alanyl-D-glutamate--2,6-diaminopimelate ligase n=1 Tax=Vibrio albus TaxID=2200953 RepID=A0A2U3BD36_9VIBR|nr:UDP-N-acetylmuramoyl-L-alanyl-D-glutamate--2,6-diaminopimelate ligase [Vibrio albus]PWI34662.1 UDP-N-acetylmuramoyl-L-alanyl-D-glutamate--2,6-diaminopimelate ligase [Vibrio albus]
MVNTISLMSLLSPWVALEDERLKSVQVCELELDSRKVKKGTTFVAVIGHAVDGRSFIAKAIENGANAVIAEACTQHPHASFEFHKEVPVIYIRELNQSLSELAGRLYQCNSQFIAVTGTNGKTTITQLIAQWINLLGQSAAVMGTTGNGFLSDLQPAANTTGSAVDIQKTLSTLSQQGAEYTALEVSSHGLVQGRVKALDFSAGVFTNLSRDHLDYHGTMEEYAQAKLSLFEQHQCRHAIINADDEIGAQWLQGTTEAVAVSLRTPQTHDKALWAEQVVYSDSGIAVSLDGYWGKGELNVPLIGAFNASNVMLALATLLALGFDKEALLFCADKLQPVIGRMELFQTPGKAKLVVDYAHTPDALEKALSALRVHCDGKLWVICGCGGDRDTGKRPMMAAIAEQLADRVIISDDNPRSEDPTLIVKDMLKGMQKPESAIVEHDRFNAVRLAVESAGERDIILLAGKGHEDYQVLRDKTVHYSDRESSMIVLGITE